MPASIWNCASARCAMPAAGGVPQLIVPGREIRARFQAFPVSGEDAFHVAGKIPDDGVDLGEADVHARLQKTPATGTGKRKKRFSG